MAFSRGPSIVKDGLVLYLDAANPKSYPGSGTNFNDISSNGNNATIVNGASFDNSNSGSIKFDGTNDTISLSQITTTNKQPWTLNFWYKLQQVRRYSSVDYALFTSSTSSVPGTVRYFIDYFMTVNTVDTLNDGSIFVGGSFLSFNGYQSNKIIKLNSDGTRDESFNIGSGFKSGNSGISEILVIKVSSSGKIYVGGTFTFYNDVNANSIIRLNTDGTIDTSFNYGTGFNSTVTDIVEDSNGNIYVVGSFTTYKGQSNGRIIKLDQFGNKDTSFNNLTLNNTPYTIYLDELDSKVYVGGNFTLYGSSTTNRLVRLNLDGSLDTSFNMSTGFNSTVWKITKINDKLYIGGSFTSVLGQTRNRMVSLNLDGTINTSFDIGTGFNTSDVIGIVWDGNGIVVVGGFTQYKGVNETRIIRLLENGNKDTTFINEGFNGFVKDVKFKNNVLYVVGNFTYYGNQRYPTVIRLNSIGNLITNNPNLVPSSEFLEIPTLTNSRSFWSYIANYSFENNISEVPNSSFSSSSLVSFSSLNGYIAVSSNLRKFNLNETITISGYFKKNTLNTVWVGGFFGNARTYFNLDAGTVTSQQSSVLSNSITDEGNGWYRCSCTYNFTNPIGNFYLYGGFGSNENGSLFVTGMQIKIGGESEYYKNDLIHEGVYRPRILFTHRNSSGSVNTLSLYLPTNLIGALYESYEYVNNLFSNWNLFTLRLSSSEIISLFYNGEIGLGSINLSTSQENFLTFNTIGAFTNNNNSLLGNISSISLYGKELTETEITTIYNSIKSRYGL